MKDKKYNKIKNDLINENENNLKKIWSFIDELSLNQKRMVLYLLENKNQETPFINDIGNYEQLFGCSEFKFSNWYTNPCCRLSSDFFNLLSYSLKYYNAISNDDINKIRSIKIENLFPDENPKSRLKPKRISILKKGDNRER